MCTGKCAKCIAVVLYPLALISIICNIILFFPDWSTKYAQGNDQGDTTLTPEVTYMGGLFGGGIMVSTRLSLLLFGRLSFFLRL